MNDAEGRKGRRRDAETKRMKNAEVRRENVAGQGILLEFDNADGKADGGDGSDEVSAAASSSAEKRVEGVADMYDMGVWAECGVVPHYPVCSLRLPVLYKGIDVQTLQDGQQGPLPTPCRIMKDGHLWVGGESGRTAIW